MDKKMFNNTNTGSRSPGPAAYSVKTTIGKLATDPSIEKNPAYSILGSRKTRNVSTAIIHVLLLYVSHN